MGNYNHTARERAMLGLLLILLLGMGYYLGFYLPLQQELTAICATTDELDSQIFTASAKVAEMDTMEAELDRILTQSGGDPAQIAPYDNKEAVLGLLHDILSRTQSYTLSFADPVIQPEGTVRRNISMVFHCGDYATARTVIQELTASPWRCLITNLSLVSDNDDLTEGSVRVTATITFFEHTGL